jgi:hypothetical protein
LCRDERLLESALEGDALRDMVTVIELDQEREPEVGAVEAVRTAPATALGSGNKEEECCRSTWFRIREVVSNASFERAV